MFWGGVIIALNKGPLLCLAIFIRLFFFFYFVWMVECKCAVTGVMDVPGDRDEFRQ